MKIFDILKDIGSRDSSLRNLSGEVGIEIETETLEAYSKRNMKFWNQVEDGSLRNFGQEYVLKVPVSRGKELTAALEEFSDKTKGLNFIQDSISTSVHVHINFLQDRWITLVNFLVLYDLFENLLIRFSGPDRLANLFALPIKDAQEEIETQVQLVKNINNLNYKKTVLSIDSYKYAALNLCNLWKLGTLEVRSHRGVTDTEVISSWVHLLMKIKDFASQDILPHQILELYKEQDSEIVYSVFGDKVSLVNYPDKKSLMDTNLWFASRVATACNFKDNSWGFPKPKKVYREKMIKELDQISQEKFGMAYKELGYAQGIVIDELLMKNYPLGSTLSGTYLETDL